MSDNIAVRHHYIPIFYTRQWTSEDGWLCQFSKPYLDKVKPKRVTPAMTGYADHLYDLDGLPERLAQQVETQFMRPLDDMAAVLLQEIDAGRYNWTTRRRREAWATFVMSLLMRTPEEVRLFKEHYVASFFEVTPQKEADYRQFHARGAPRTLQAFLAATDRETVVRMALTTLVELMESPRVVEHIINMRWGIRNFALGVPSLLTSDRPVLVSNPLIGTSGYLMLPIAPNRLFYAVTDWATERRLATEPWQRLIPAINRSICEQAVNFVYGKFDIALPFIQEHMGQVQQPSIVARMTALGVGFGLTRRSEAAFSIPKAARSAHHTTYHHE